VIPGQANVYSGREAGSLTPAYVSEVVCSRSHSGPENEGHMSFTLRTKKNILSMATTAMFLLGIGSSTPANDQRRTTSVNRPSGIITVGKIDSRCRSCNKGTRRFQCKYPPAGRWAHPGHRSSRSVRQRGPCRPSEHILSFPAIYQGRRRDSLFHCGRHVQISSCFS